MSVENKAIAIELITKALPYPQHISNWGIDDEAEIRFTWRHTNFKFDLKYCSVEEIGDGVSISSDTSILMEKLIKIELVNRIG